MPTTVTGKNVWLNEVRPWQWLEMGATLLAFFAWVTAVLALGADRPLAGILLGLVPGVLLVHVASWLLPTVLGGQRQRWAPTALMARSERGRLETPGMALRWPVLVVLGALGLASSLAGCATTERNDDTIACPRPVSFQGRLYRQVGTASDQAVGQRLGPAELHTCTMPDGTDLDPLPVGLHELRSIDPTTALAAKSQGRWTVFAPFDARGRSYCSLPGIRCHQP